MSHAAQCLKSTLALGQTLRGRQADAGFQLLRTQLAFAGACLPSQGLQDWLGLQFDFMAQCCRQMKEASHLALAQGRVCLADLRRAENPDDVAFVAAAFAREAQAHMQKGGNEAALLIQSTGAAARVVVERLLDEVIGADASGAVQQA
jgi:hypothetical protein